MRPLVVVALPKRIEPALLGAQARRGWTRGLALEFAVHAFVRAVLLGTGRREALMHDPELHPPDVQPGEAIDARGRETASHSGADGFRQAHRAKQRAKDGLRVVGGHRAQPVAREHGLAEMVGDGQGKAVVSVVASSEHRGPAAYADRVSSAPSGCIASPVAVQKAACPFKRHPPALWRRGVRFGV